MEKRRLGGTGLEVSVVGMGGLFISRRGQEDRAEARRAVHRAIELGVNYVDTAPSYQDSEEVLGYALADAPGPFILSTKIGGRPQPFNPRDKAALRGSVKESLRLLRRDRVDVLFVHEPDRPGQYDWWSDWDNFHGPVEDLLSELKAEGLIRFTALGGTTAYELARIVATSRYDIVLTALNYSLLWREAEIAILPEAKRQGMGIIIGSPFHQGALARRYDEQVSSGAPWLSPPRREQYRRLYAVIDEIGIPLPELALRFVISNPDISMTLMGARSVAEVEANVNAATKGPLPPDVLARLREIADLVPFRPFEEPFSLPFERPFRGPGPASRG
ncbi:MAG: aldo/keto reductase [Alphaproteobacteria bacterium]|nr:aldo/keto reductase [Alphaproteobacteria bacterium]